MGDDFDPCECYWNHEVAMRRLLSLLRQGQSYCTDNECADDIVPGLQPARTDTSSLTMMMICWAVVVVVLYMMRPASLRSSRHTDGKPNADQHGPPPPPALM